MMQTPNATVYISNLSYNRDRNGLKSMFLPFGKIKNIKIIVEPTTNQSRGMAFVEMTSAADAKKAIEGLNETIVDGRTVKAKYATPLKSAPIKNVIMKSSKPQKDLDFKEIQLKKKARNEAKRNSNPLKFKVASKKTT
jgi:RNA recognition motif-containing protein